MLQQIIRLLLGNWEFMFGIFLKNGAKKQKMCSFYCELAGEVKCKVCSWKLYIELWKPFLFTFSFGSQKN